ncbi:MAG: hypothetical protein ACLFQR_07985 [Desulfovibrionales bacterium]
MGWKFWQKKEDIKGSKAALPKPKDIPDEIGRYLVIQKQMDPDFVWALKGVMKAQTENVKIWDYRLFCPTAAQEAGVSVVNYHSLDAHPELVLFYGQFDKSTKKFDIHEGSTPLPGTPLPPEGTLPQPSV